MDNKNVSIAIALSMSVLLFWAAFLKVLNQLTIMQLKHKRKLMKML